MKSKIMATAAAVSTLLAGPAAALAADGPQPPPPAKAIDITFVKHLTDPQTVTFHGTTAGAVRGDLTSQLIGQTAPATTEYEFVEFRWTITSPARSFTAVTTGTLDTTTGVVAMTGTVTNGWNQGAEVLERGQLVDPTTETFTGDLVLLTR